MSKAAIANTSLGLGDVDALVEEFSRLSHASIEEIVIARIHLNNEDPQDARDVLRAVELNLARMRQILEAR